MKKTHQKLLLFIIVSACSYGQISALTSTSVSNSEASRNPISDVKVHTWWHWMDGNITKEGITKDLESMAKQGIGQATILNTGFLINKEIGVKRIAFNSPEWHDHFVWALQEASRLGISIGAHNCDGWSASGGPWINSENSMKEIAWTKTYLKGGKTHKLKLATPASRKDFFTDVALLAYKVKSLTPVVSKKYPICKQNDKVISNILNDGSAVSEIELSQSDKLYFNYPKAICPSQIVILPRITFNWTDTENIKATFVLSASKDGKEYTELKRFDLKGINQPNYTDLPESKSKFYKLELIHVEKTGYGEYRIAEIEFLEKNQQANFATNTPFLLAKSGTVRPSSQQSFDSPNPSDVGAAINPDEVLILNGKMTADGTLKWKAPKGNWCVLRFGYTTTGSQNRPATPEGLGLECDKMDTTALNIHFDGFAKKMIQHAGKYTGNTFKFLLVDSWECEFQNWTNNLPATFEKNRAYSIYSWLPALCGETVGSGEQTEAFLYDFRKTVGEMIDENYYGHFKKLCQRNGLEMHAEAIYGESNYPSIDVLKANKHADMPMFEFWWEIDNDGLSKYKPSFLPYEIWPAAAATFYDKPVIGAEAYTGMASYSESPAEIKLFGDKAFCSGINQMILHSYVHQPVEKTPGVTLGIFSSHFNRNNPYWEQTSEWMKYQQRIQAVLQEGLIASNILYYIGDKLPQYSDYAMLNSVPFGYLAIACNLDILQNNIKVIGSKMVTDKGLEYPLLVLPNTNKMEYSSLKLIASLVEQGAVILGPKPESQLSLQATLTQKEDFKSLTDKLWKNERVTAYGKGKVLTNMTIPEAITSLKLTPDFATHSNDSLHIMYIRKKQGEKDVYFVFNQRDTVLNTTCKFGVGNKTPRILNPINGAISAPEKFSIENGCVSFPMTFKPRESFIVVFDKNPEPLKVCTTKSETISVSNLEATLTFKPTYDKKIDPVTLKTLQPLTSFENPEIKYFAGEVHYKIKFSLPEKFANTKDSFELDLGQFAATAEVSLNGKSIGTVWMPGTKLPVKQLIQKENILEVTLKTVYRNRIIGDFVQYGEFKNGWTTTPMSLYLGKDKPLIPVGLFGPITIVKHNEK